MCNGFPETGEGMEGDPVLQGLLWGRLERTPFLLGLCCTQRLCVAFASLNCEVLPSAIRLPRLPWGLATLKSCCDSSPKPFLCLQLAVRSLSQSHCHQIVCSF